jgi:hypothetical protein
VKKNPIHGHRLKILVTGDHRARDTPRTRQIVREAFEEVVPVGPFVLVHGDAEGFDRICADVAKAMYGEAVEIRSYAVDEEKDGAWPVAGTNRNDRMLRAEHHPHDPVDICLAFPGPLSAGTWSMVNLCDRERIRVRVCG